jgi:hypothetical protein
MGSGCIDPHFLDLGTSWRWVVNLTPRPLYSRGKSPRYPLDRRLGGPQSAVTPRRGLISNRKDMETEWQPCGFVFGRCLARISAGALALLVEVFLWFFSVPRGKSQPIELETACSMSTESCPKMNMDYTRCTHQELNSVCGLESQ